MLSNRFVGSARGDAMGGRTLKEHCEGSKIIENYTFNYSKQALADLGFISEINSVWIPNDDENVRNIEINRFCYEHNAVCRER